MESAVKLYSLSARESRTWMLAGAFVIGNIVLPQLCHLIPQGGLIFLPIYFFTLIAAYKYGITAGIMTAVLSPLANSLLFGMPDAAVLPVLLEKSVLLAVFASMAARKTGKVSFLAILAAVAMYQAAGSCIEGLMAGSAAAALQDITLGLPGIALQVFGGFLCLKAIERL